MLDLGLIDGIKTPEELGLHYLQESTEPILASGMLDAIRRVPQELAQDFFNGNEPVAVDLGTSSPIDFGQLRDGGQLASTDYAGVGYVNASGKPQPITPNEISDMATTEANSGGTITSAPEAQTILVADTSGTFAQGRRVPVIDLIAYNRRNGHLYLVPNVNINALCRDAVNGALRGTIRRVDFSRIGRPQRRTNPFFR